MFSDVLVAVSVVACLEFRTEGKKANGTAQDKNTHFRISNNIPDLPTHHGILTLHNELVKILKLLQQGLDQKPIQSPARKRYAIIFLVYYYALVHLALRHTTEFTYRRAKMNKHPPLANERSSLELSIENRLKQAEQISLFEFLNITANFNVNLKLEFSKSCLKQTGSADFEGNWTPYAGCFLFYLQQSIVGIPSLL